MSLIFNPSTATSPGAVLLYQVSGSSTAAGATVVASYAFASGALTAADALLSIVSMRGTTQATGDPHLYNVTDSVKILDLINAGAAAAAGAGYLQTVLHRKDNLSSVATNAVGWGRETNPDANWNNPTFTTNWIDAWTLGLRHTGVTAGGTFNYNWSLYKLVGQ